MFLHDSFFFISVPECRQSEGECDDLIVYLMMLWGVWLRWVWWPPRWTTSSSTFPSSPAIWPAQTAISRRSLLVYCSCLHVPGGAPATSRSVTFPSPVLSETEFQSKPSIINHQVSRGEQLCKNFESWNGALYLSCLIMGNHRNH